MIYDYQGLDDLQEVTDRTVEYLRRHKDKFDFIAVRGFSGALVGSPAALRLNKPLVVIRKPDESNHQGCSALINGRYASGRYVFLDDFISSGATERAVSSALTDCTYAGRFLYDRDSQTEWFKSDAEVAA